MAERNVEIGKVVKRAAIVGIMLGGLRVAQGLANLAGQRDLLLDLTKESYQLEGSPNSISYSEGDLRKIATAIIDLKRDGYNVDITNAIWTDPKVGINEGDTYTSQNEKAVEDLLGNSDKNHRLFSLTIGTTFPDGNLGWSCEAGGQMTLIANDVKNYSNLSQMGEIGQQCSSTPLLSTLNDIENAFGNKINIANPPDITRFGN